MRTVIAMYQSFDQGVLWRMLIKKPIFPVIAVVLLVLFPCAGVFASEQGFSDQVMNESQNNIDYLAAKSLKKAKALLKQHGDFAPFGAGLLRDGSVKHVWAVKPGEKLDNINPVLVLNSIRTALAEQSRTGRLLGSAVIYKYRPKKSEQARINIELEYVTGYARVLSTEYKEAENGEYKFGHGVRQDMDPVVFKHLVEN